MLRTSAGSGCEGDPWSSLQLSLRGALPPRPFPPPYPGSSPASTDALLPPLSWGLPVVSWLRFPGRTLLLLVPLRLPNRKYKGSCQALGKQTCSLFPPPATEVYWPTFFTPPLSFFTLDSRPSGLVLGPGSCFPALVSLCPPPFYTPLSRKCGLGSHSPRFPILWRRASLAGLRPPRAGVGGPPWHRSGSATSQAPPAPTTREPVPPCCCTQRPYPAGVPRTGPTSATCRLFLPFCSRVSARVLAGSWRLDAPIMGL